MLVVTRKVGERIVIGENVTVTVVRIAGGMVRIGVEAPADYAIVRRELMNGGSEQESQQADNRRIES
jgi:carbon storage regulator